MSRPRTDNHNLNAKLTLRRALLADIPAPHVFDACQGSGVIWNHLRKQFSVASYWGVDEKPKKGRVKINSARVLEQPGWNFDVVDIDTYGTPWRHYFATVRNMRERCTVFLTIGRYGPAIVSISAMEFAAMGLGKFQQLRKLPGLSSTLAGMAVDYCVNYATANGVKIQRMVEAENPGGNARYIGLRLERNEVTQSGLSDSLCAEQ